MNEEKDAMGDSTAEREKRLDGGSDSIQRGVGAPPRTRPREGRWGRRRVTPPPPGGPTPSTPVTQPPAPAWRGGRSGGCIKAYEDVEEMRKGKRVGQERWMVGKSRDPRTARPHPDRPRHPPAAQRKNGRSGRDHQMRRGRRTMGRHEKEEGERIRGGGNAPRPTPREKR